MTVSMTVELKPTGLSLDTALAVQKLVEKGNSVEIDLSEARIGRIDPTAFGVLVGAKCRGETISFVNIGPNEHRILQIINVAA